MTSNKALARSRLDKRSALLRSLRDEPRPHKGWIRGIRDALGMSTSEMATRLGVTQQAAAAIERNEQRDTIRLETLRRAADALDCDLVYALVPRRSLADAVAAQARRKAVAHLRGVTHHSRLEDQAVSDDDTAAQVNELAARLMDRRGLWTEASSRR